MIAEVGADSEFSEIGIVAYRKHTLMLDLTVPRDFLCGNQASHVPDLWTQIMVFSHLGSSGVDDAYVYKVSSLYLII